MECMKHINRIAKLNEIDYLPLAQNVDTNFVHAWADCLYWLPIAWFESTLNRSELEACGTASFIGEVPKIVEARSHEIERFMVTTILYKFLYILQAQRLRFLLGGVTTGIRRGGFLPSPLMLMLCGLSHKI